MLITALRRFSTRTLERYDDDSTYDSPLLMRLEHG